MYANDVRVIQQGSPLFTFFVPQITHGAGNYWYDLATMLALSGGAPTAAFWQYMDSVVILNNSPTNLTVYLNQIDNPYYILAYGNQPISRRAFRTLGFDNNDAANDIAANLVVVQMRRLPPSGIVTTQS